MNIEFIAGFAVITSDPAQSRKLYIDALGLPLTSAEGDDYVHSESIGGANHFGVWPLNQVAQACFGQDDWPSDVALPQASVEFELGSEDAVAEAATELRDAGFELLHDSRTEPWGQTVARLLSDEGLVVGISYAPWLHSDN